VLVPFCVMDDKGTAMQGATGANMRSILTQLLVLMLPWSQHHTHV
jgi:hypothetical protein